MTTRPTSEPPYGPPHRVTAAHAGVKRQSGSPTLIRSGGAGVSEAAGRCYACRPTRKYHWTRPSIARPFSISRAKRGQDVRDGEVKAPPPPKGSAERGNRCQHTGSTSSAR